jgi:hypothetical protein
MVPLVLTGALFRASLTQIDAEQLFAAVGSRPTPPLYVMKPRARLLA